MCFTKYYKNFILCGEADYHCLLCDETFHKLDDIEKHIRWEKHRKVLKIQTCMPKLKNDGVFKIESYYYCQYCNHVAHNMASVKEHIKTEKHLSNKTTPEAVFKKIKANYDFCSGTVIINETKIDRYQWHGIQNKSCCICNAEVTDVSKHIETQNHIIRLIQTEIKYEGEDKCYRKVNETVFHCFKCMIILSSENFDKHQHNKIAIEPRKKNGNSEYPIRIYDRKQYLKLCDREYDIAKLANIDDEFYNVDVKNKQITCKQCKIAVKNSENALSDHMYIKHEIFSDKSNILKQIREDSEQEYIFIYEKDAGKARHEMAIYGKDNHIKLNEGGSKGYCMLCDRYLSAHINIFKQHVGGSVHTGHLELKGLMKAKKHMKGSTRMEIFSRHLFKLEYITDWDAIAVNMKFCIDRDSFLLIKRIEHGKNFRLTKCFVCDETFKWWKEKEHCETKTHRSHVMSAKAIIDDFNFIREIKPKLYHCGLCNITLPFWETLEKHIDDLSHKMKVLAKHFVSAMKHCQEKYGNLPETKKIECSSNNDVLYSNIMKVLFENKLGDIRVFTIDLEKLQKSKFKGVILV